ncbi:FecR family protein [Pedobacter africanus]|uniref:FecR family protein n=1 Tax=Pedobacter africanus TaxID=151894 RepID=A0A1W2BCF2_9SPHI|nr:FecR domain-containing protein [Pedobacter africanus]SMC70703.1 FecR family protein [Pedobacter africanus]
MNRIKATELLRKYVEGTCTDEEQQLFEQWYANLNSEDHHLLTENELKLAEQEMLGRLPVSIPAKTVRLWPYATVAAAIGFAIVAALWLYKPDPKTSNSNMEIQARNNILPGNNKAILTLADGSRISLTDAMKGELAEQAGVSITKTRDGQLVYQIKDSGKNANVYNTIETPRGGQHQVILPDGSKVWLNAASWLRFPSSLALATERRVELRGEAYFEIVHKSQHSPFVVVTAKQEIEVLGTHFNVSSYADEGTTRTTLLEGAVRLNVFTGQSYVLKPGQQAVSGENQAINIRNVDVNAAVDWKEGLFVFNKESLESIMQKLSRWYDVDVVFENEQLKKQLFGGRVSRFSTVAEVLDVLELTDLAHFKTEGRRIMVVK